MKLAETLRQRCLLSVSLCNVGRDFSSIPDLCSYCLNFLVQCDTHCVKRVVIQYCITRVFMCYAHVIHVLSACV